MGKEVIDRCNLTVLSEPGQEDLAAFLAENKVRPPTYTVDYEVFVVSFNFTYDVVSLNFTYIEKVLVHNGSRDPQMLGMSNNP